VGCTGEVPSSIPNLDDCNHEENPFASSSFADDSDSIKGTLLVSVHPMPRPKEEMIVPFALSSDTIVKGAKYACQYKMGP
jgi:hypothetical protein